jgi:hypothetical protein
MRQMTEEGIKRRKQAFRDSLKISLPVFALVILLAHQFGLDWYISTCLGIIIGAPVVCLAVCASMLEAIHEEWTREEDDCVESEEDAFKFGMELARSKSYVRMAYECYEKGRAEALSDMTVKHDGGKGCGS